MAKELKVLEFDKKKKLLAYVNSNAGKLEIVSISTSQVAYEYKHFLWFYEIA